MTKKSKGLTYADSGVSIAEGDAFVERIAKTTKGIGGFSGAFPLNFSGMKQPVLLAGTDGVGTKLLVAREMKKLDTIGIDLVAMVVNDLIVCGAKPLFFLDYYATGKLTAKESDAILSGIQEGCAEAGIPLIGGETAEMPGLYDPGDFDLAGFGVGIADRSDLIDGSKVRPGDVVIGISSSGIHSNGYSLVRATCDHANKSYKRSYKALGGKLGEALLTPTRVYVKSVLKLLKTVKPTAMAHVTGGGIDGNLVRVLPKGCAAVIDGETWEAPNIFSTLQEWGDIALDEMRNVFNLGIGFVVVVRPEDEKKCLRTLHRAGEKAYSIGRIIKDERRVLWSSPPPDAD